MPKIYFISKLESGYYSVHSLIREIFNSPENPCFSMTKGDLVLVASKSPPKKSVHFSERVLEQVSDEDKVVKIDMNVAFDNRHRGNTGSQKILPAEALARATALCGLVTTSNSSCYFIGPCKENKFIIHNTFRIFGDFEIKNHELLNRAIMNGVGSRKSYGFGMILTERKVS